MAANASARMSGIIALTYPSLLNPTTGPPESAYIPVTEPRHHSYGIRRKIGNNIIDSLSMTNILPCCNSYLLLTVRKLDGILASGMGGVNAKSRPGIVPRLFVNVKTRLTGNCLPGLPTSMIVQHSRWTAWESALCAGWRTGHDAPVDSGIWVRIPGGAGNCCGRGDGRVPAGSCRFAFRPFRAGTARGNPGAHGCPRPNARAVHPNPGAYGCS